MPGHRGSDAVEPVDQYPEHSGEVIMAIHMGENHTIGCAYYSSAEACLYIAEDSRIADMELVAQLLLHGEPTTVLLSSQVPENIRQVVNQYGESSCYDNNLQRLNTTTLMEREFNSSTAKQDVLLLRDQLKGNISANLPTINDAMISSSVNTDIVGCFPQRGPGAGPECDISYNCAAVVLKELELRRSVPSTHGLECVRRVEPMVLTSQMHISIESLVSLQIFQENFHPNTQTWGNAGNRAAPKDSSSLFGLFCTLTSTPQGKTSLKRIFVRPTLNIDVIQNRQSTISTLLAPGNINTTKSLPAILRTVPNARVAISHLKTGVGTSNTGYGFQKSAWVALCCFGNGLASLQDALTRLERFNGTNTISILLQKIDFQQLLQVVKLIQGTIDFDQSVLQQKVSVKPGLDIELDKQKRFYDGMESFLGQVLTELKAELPTSVRPGIRSCVFMPQMGFLVATQRDEATGKGIYYGQQSPNDCWEMLFSSEDDVFYKNRHMRDLDQAFGDIYSKITDRELEIIQSLSDSILSFEVMLTEASDACGDFDAILALARGADMYKFNAPHVVTNRSLVIKHGRHPLQELAVKVFVPNGCSILYPAHVNLAPTVVITGPNQSGKSVYLKQVALIVYLAQIGSFVPAESAEIGVVDKIFVRLSTRESTARNESAFAIDLRQVSQALQWHTPQSLLLIDEFGKGTNSDDGSGLMAGLLHHLLSLDSAPRTLVATHFYELFNQPALQITPKLDFYHMEVFSNSEIEAYPDEFIYSFHLRRGKSNSSFGSRCALLNGIPQAIVRRTDNIFHLLNNNESSTCLGFEITDEYQARLSVAENATRDFLLLSFDSASTSEAEAFLQTIV